MTDMIYRRLGRSGLRVSALSLGSWVTYHNQVDVKSAAEMMAAAFDWTAKGWPSIARTPSTAST